MTKDKSVAGENLPEWFEPLGQWMDKVKDELQHGLTTLIERTVKLELELPRLYTTEEIEAVLPEGPVTVSVGFSAKEIGKWHFLFPRPLTATLSDLAMMGEGEAEFDEMLHPGTLAEIWGQVVATLEMELNALIGGELTIDMPESTVESSPALNMLGESPVMRWNLEIEKAREGFILMIPEPAFAVMFGASPIEDAAPAPPSPEAASEEAEAPVSTDEPSPADKPTMKAPPPKPSAVEQPVVKTADFESFGEPAVSTLKPSKDPRNIHILMDVSLPITIELGRTQMLIKDVLELGPGSIIELDKLSGEPVDLYVNDKLFAKGEVVVIEENFGVRITELIKIEERLEALR